MQNAFWDDESLSWSEANGAILQINGQLAFDYIKQFIVVIVFVPMVLTLDHTDPDNRRIDLAKCLIEPRHLRIGERLLIDNLKRSMQDIEPRIVREIFKVAHL